LRDVNVLDLARTRLHYEVSGEGEPVLFTHARPFVRWYDPLIERLDGWTVIRCHRGPADEPGFGIETDADHVARLIDHLEIERPHLVGHSYGGLVALALALRDDRQFRSLTLLEPATSGLLTPEQAAAGFAPIVELVARQGPVTAMGQFLRTVCGEDGPAALESVVPGGLGQARDAAPAFFAGELRAVIDWRFDPDRTRRIDCPVLLVDGARSDVRFRHGVEILHELLPAARRVTVQGVGHLLMAAEPDRVAEQLVAFWQGRNAQAVTVEQAPQTSS
jgi:pimeloyl-ACP methyl ester carboxylesterase